VRRISIGVVFFGNWRRMLTTFGWSLRFAVEANALEMSAYSFLLGRCPCQSRKTVSSNVEWATRSSTS
jgi:hypothetical protein